MSAITKGRTTGSRLALAIHLALFATAGQAYAAAPWPALRSLRR